MIFLTEAFPSRAEASFDFIQSRLSGVSDEAFEWAVLDIVDNVERLYPDDNLIAMIRDRARRFELRRREQNSPLITEERWEAPPEEWTRLKEKLKFQGVKQDQVKK